MNILIGADPEIWIVDNKTGKPISAEGLFEGTKAAPKKVQGGAIQVDGMAAEFNIDPSSNQFEFARNILTVLIELREEIKRNNPDLDFSFSFTPVAYFGSEYIQAQPEHAKELGCTPDYNAYEGGAANPTPDADMPFRTASGHIHIGWGEGLDIADPEHLEACCMFVKQMDTYVGGRVAAIEGPDGHIRRELYGKAGAFRPKSYGVEYRTSSNVWLSDLTTIYRTFSATKEAFDQLVDGYRSFEDPYWKTARKVIDSGDLVKQGNLFAKFPRSYNNQLAININTLDTILERVMHDGGFNAVIDDDFDDIDDEWDFDEPDDEFEPELADWEPELAEPQPIPVAPWRELDEAVVNMQNAAAGVAVKARRG